MKLALKRAILSIVGNLFWKIHSLILLSSIDQLLCNKSDTKFINCFIELNIEKLSDHLPIIAKYELLETTQFTPIRKDKQLEKKVLIDWNNNDMLIDYGERVDKDLIERSKYKEWFLIGNRRPLSNEKHYYGENLTENEKNYRNIKLKLK